MIHCPVCLQPFAQVLNGMDAAAQEQEDHVAACLAFACGEDEENEVEDATHTDGFDQSHAKKPRLDADGPHRQQQHTHYQDDIQPDSVSTEGQIFFWREWMEGLKAQALPLPVNEWLHNLGLSHLLSLFQQHLVDEIAVPLLKQGDLEAMGISDPSTRALLLQSISSLSHHQHTHAATECEGPTAVALKNARTPSALNSDSTQRQLSRPESKQAALPLNETTPPSDTSHSHNMHTPNPALHNPSFVPAHSPFHTHSHNLTHTPIPHFFLPPPSAQPSKQNPSASHSHNPAHTSIPVSHSHHHAPSPIPHFFLPPPSAQPSEQNPSASHSLQPTPNALPHQSAAPFGAMATSHQSAAPIALANNSNSHKPPPASKPPLFNIYAPAAPRITDFMSVSHTTSKQQASHAHQQQQQQQQQQQNQGPQTHQQQQQHYQQQQQQQQNNHPSTNSSGRPLVHAINPHQNQHQGLPSHTGVQGGGCVGVSVPKSSSAFNPHTSINPHSNSAFNPHSNNAPKSSSAFNPQSNNAPKTNSAFNPHSNNAPKSSSAFNPQSNNAPKSSSAFNPQSSSVSAPNTGGPSSDSAAGSRVVGAARHPCLLQGVPRCHTIPGTRFCVDFFKPKEARSVRGSNGYWILTHFHADHYGGLAKSFSFGTVVCSPITAQLVITKLKVPAARIMIIPLDRPTVVDGVQLTFVDANHCPGAVMIVAEVQGRPPVIHTGDCRLTSAMQEVAILKAVSTARPTLVLDTTYCSPQYTFPSQAEALQYTLNAVKSELFNQRVLFVFGTYTVGKERIFLEVAKAHNKKVYVSKDKFAILQCCGLTPDYARLLTTNHLEATFHAVPLFKVTHDGLSSILEEYRGRYNTVVGIRPTGWALQSTRGKASTGGGRRTQRRNVVIHEVPYSEHSSFTELREFVQWLQPGEIVPSVFPSSDNNSEQPQSHQAVAAHLVSLLTGAPPVLAQNKPPAGCKPITTFFGAKKQTGVEQSAHQQQ